MLMAAPVDPTEFVVVRISDEPGTARFHGELLEPAFGMFADELDTLETFRSLQASGTQQVLAAVGASGTLAGGCCVEAFARSRCALVTYLVVKPEFQRRGIARALLSAALALQPSDTRAVLLETHDDSVQAADVMQPRVRRRVLRRLGFRCLNLPYVQPRLSHASRKCRNLILAAHEAFALDPDAVAGFLREFYESLQQHPSDEDLAAMLGFVRMGSLGFKQI
jgi:ribosomal protein S18 acetylase RimI-like enzyme